MANACVGPGARIGGVLLAAALGVAGAEASPTMDREVIGRSPGGEAITVFTIAGEDTIGRDEDLRPAIAVIGGVQGHHQIGATVADAMGRLLIDEHADALIDRTVYIIPRVNPEGLARFASARSARALSGRAPEAVDADRDRRVAEDPPNDLDGDGFITMMRVPAPRVEFGLEPTHVVDADDARIVREPGDDERATHALLIEGVDDDGDGRFNEDGWGGASGGGVDLDMHFPTHWPEHTDGAGRFPLDRPEARVVAEWLQSRGNIVAVIVLGPHDTIASVPPAGKYGPDGRVPKGIEEDDVAAYTLVGESFKEITGITKTEDGPDRAGSLLQWCYADLGVYTFGTPVWVRPDLLERDDAESDSEAGAAADDAAAEDEPREPTAEEIEAADRADLAQRNVGQMFIDYLYMDTDARAAVEADVESMNDAEYAQLVAQFTALPGDVQRRSTMLREAGVDPGPRDEVLAALGAAPGAGAGVAGGAVDDSGDAKWLAWIDENADEGFIDWRPFDHPQLGLVEIGGFVPGVRVNPPAEQEAELSAQQAEFAASLLGMLPRVEFDEPTVERVGGGVWRVGLTLRNTGTLPTKSAIGVKARRLPGMVCVLDPNQELETDRIVSGSRAIRFDAIDGRGVSERAEWLVIAERGDTIALDVRSPLFGTQRFELTMETE